MTTFADFFKPDDLQRLLDFRNENPRPSSDDKTASEAWYMKIHDARQEIIVKAAMRFFKAKLKAGELKPVANSGGRSVNFAHFWDALVLNTGKAHIRNWAVEEMEEVFSYILLSPGINIYKIIFAGDEEEQLDLDAIYNEFVAFIDAGDFSFHAVSQMMACGITGEYIHIQFEDWTPVLGTVTRSTGFTKCVPIEPKKKCETVQIEFKTGDLVAMDWFRFENALKAWTDANGDGDLPSVGNNAGICANTKFYAEKFGIVYVFVGNSSPNVFTNEETGVIAVGDNWRQWAEDGRRRYSDADEDGNESEEACEEYEHAQENAPAGFVDQGSVCTDLWWVTIMDRSRLREILIEQLGEDRLEEIDAYVASDFDVNMQVEPGKYTLHYDGNPQSFYQLLDDKTKFSIGTPYFALTKDPA